MIRRAVGAELDRAHEATQVALSDGFDLKEVRKAVACSVIQKMKQPLNQASDLRMTFDWASYPVAFFNSSTATGRSHDFIHPTC
jgi:hypothetical protein